MSFWSQLAKYARFETDRLWFRPFQYEDLADFYAMASDVENMQFIFPAQEDLERVEELMVSAFMQKPLGVWAIVDKQTQQCIGAIRLEHISPAGKSAELGYFLHRAYWRKGLMTEAVESLVALARFGLGMEKLTIITHAENIASQRVAEKTGFQVSRRYKGSDRYTHRMRDYIAFTYHLREG